MTVIDGKNIKELVGKVVSTKTNKTITVVVERVKMHPLYKKRYTVAKKYYAHDEKNTANEGDMVKIQETKPISKLKKWKLVEVIEQATLVS